MSDIFDEVEEGMRQEDFAAFLRRYGAWIIAGLVLFLVAVAGVTAFRSWQADRAAEAGDKFIKALDSDPAATKPVYDELSKSGPGGYKALAAMMQAEQLQAAGDLPGAISALERAAEQAKDPIVKDSALLRAAYIAADVQDFAALDRRLQPLVKRRGAYGLLARELLGVEAYEAGKLDRARQEFAYIETQIDAPQGVQQRAQRYLQVLGPEPAGAAAPNPPAPAPTTQGPKAASGEKQ